MPRDFFRKNWLWDVAAAIAVVLLPLAVVLLSLSLILFFLWLAKTIGISDEFLQLLQTPYVLLFILVLVVLYKFSRQIGGLIDRIKTLPGVRFHKQVSVQPDEAASATDSTEMAKTLREFIGKIPASGQTAANKDESGVKTETGKSVPIGGSLAEIQRKAKAEDAKSQNRLGVCYANGEGVARDDAKAVEWYRLAAEQGYVPAQYNLGVCYANGKGVARDDAAAVKWYAKAAEQEDALAQYILGVCYANGRGVEWNEAEAAKWYAKSAEQGLANAQNNLGWCYANGRGVARDEAEAVKWYAKAAEQGLAAAQNNLGWCYANGEGIARDDAEAVKWFRRAAEQGYAEAQRNLGIAYHNGNGVPQSPWEAYVWHSIAAANGIRESEKFRDDDARLLSAEDLARAQAEAVRRAEDIRKRTEKKE